MFAHTFRHNLVYAFNPQYDGAFKSQRLQNWCETKRFKEVTWLYKQSCPVVLVAFYIA